MLIVGSMYLNPDLFLDYSELIKSNYDFNQASNKFLYDSLVDLYSQHAGTEINEVKINIYMNSDTDRKAKYEYLKGYKYIDRIMKLVDLDDFPTYYEKLKKYSLLREFERKGFPVQKLMGRKDFDKICTEDIIKGMEYQINTIGTVIGGVEDSIILGHNMPDKIEEWELTPDVGVPIPFAIINGLLRGLRGKKFNLFGMHSGCGKSRTTSKIACHLGIKLQIPVLVLVNEQDEAEWLGMQISCVLNNPEFGFDIQMKRKGIDGIDETKIVTGTLNKDEKEIVKEAAQYIKANSKIYFLELNKYDENTLKRQIKRHKLRNCQLIIYDTMKAPDHDWMTFVRTADMLKEVASTEDIPVWSTFQLTDDSLFNDMLTSQAIANGKHIKHVADSLMMAKPISRDQYDKFVIYNPNDPFIGESTTQLEMHINYYMVVIDKNRGGKDKDILCFEVDKGKNLWIEKGYLVPSQGEKELKQLKKENKKLKTEKEVANLRKALNKD
ncbi:DnaB-like helicase C-terminal domain-containing protein [Paenibacillus sp. O199]|uniref:DnaB-like helicase C-terminal domain-containing protein n=1 Tax=Paenibacillus sp. O199 TaxID=1643925 RepID=UPI0007BF0606|nr:DnaB-like helicase C-terminal domain-containing protein [Paenibacillus sp. O199]